MNTQVHGGFRFTPEQSVGQRTQAFLAGDGAPLAQIIRWLRPLNDHIVLCKDGSMLTCADFVGVDLDSASVHSLEQIRSQLQYALEQIQQEGPVLSWHVRRRVTTRYPRADYPDPISRRMDELQHSRFLTQVQYVNRHTLTLSIAPQAGSARVLQAMQSAQERGGSWQEQLDALRRGLWGAVKGEDEFPYQSLADIDLALTHCQKVLATFLSAISGLQPTVLRGEALGGFLQLCASPTCAIDTLCALPGDDAYLDETMPVDAINNEFADVLHFTHNTNAIWASCYTLDLRKRQALSMDVLDGLMSAPFAFTLTHVFKALPGSKGKNVVAQVENYHKSRQYSIKTMLMAALGKGDVSTAHVKANRHEDAAQALLIKDEVEAGRKGVGFYYGTVVVQTESLDDLRLARKACEEVLQAAHLNPRLEGLHKFSSWCATVPGSHEEVARWVKIVTENFTDLCPVRTISQGAFYNEHLSEQLAVPCPALLALSTRNKTPFYYTGYVSDLGHELIVGPSGTGKTALATLLWSQFRKYPGARVVIFDKNYSCRPAVYLQGGSYIDLNQERQGDRHRHTMSPVAALLASGNLEHLPFLANWIELLARQRGYQPSAADRKELERAFRATAEIGKEDPDALRLGTIVVRLDSTSELSQALDMWVGQSALAAYFDNPYDSFDLSNLVGVEMGSILSQAELAAPFMSYAFYRLASQLRDMGAGEKPIPTLIYIPEAWYFIGQPAFAAEMQEWLVTLRKLGARVCFDTQNPDKLVASDIFAAFRDNVPCMIFTPNEKAKTSSLLHMYTQELGMGEEEVRFIVEGIPKQDYYIRQGNVSRRISFGLSSELLACVRSDVRAQKLLEHFIAQGLPAGWQQQYLEQLQ